MVILILINFNDLVGVFMILPLSLQIIKALNLYRKKTGTDNYFWVKSLNWQLINQFGIAFGYIATGLTLLPISLARFILIRKCLLELVLVVGAVMLQQLCGQQINSVVVLPLKRSSKSGLVRLVLIFLSSSLMEQPTVRVGVRYAFYLAFASHIPSSCV